MNGLLIKTRFWGPDGMSIKRPESPIAPSAIDILCRNPGSAITGSTTAGYAAVVMDYASYTLGRLPPIVVTDSIAPTTIPMLGVIAPQQDSVAASGGLAWVRIWGYHPYVKVDGTTDVNIGDPLVLTSSNLKKFTAAEVICGFALAARTTNSVGPLACDIHNPYRFPVSRIQPRQQAEGAQPMGISSQANLTMREGVSPLLEPAWNFGSSDIPVGQLVARDIAASDSSATADALRRRKSHGIAVPATDNVQRLWGIVAGVNGRPAKAGAAAQVCTGGLCQAWIDVPASTAIAEGVPLIMSTAWNTATTPDSVTYYPYLTPLYANTPTLETPAVVEPANPIAYLREAIASGSARQVLAWVDVVPYRRPLRWTRTFNMSGTAGLPIAATGLILLEAEGPGSIDRLIGQAADAGSGGGPLTVDVMISPKGSTPAQLSVLSSLMTIPHDSTNLGVWGAWRLYNGDTDAAAFSVGTGGLQPVFSALVNRQFNGKAMLVANVAAVNTALVHLSVQACGWYY